MAMMRVLSSPRSCLRRLHTSKPLMPGKPKSSSTISGRKARAIVSAPDHYHAGRAAASTAVCLIQEGLRDGSLRVAPREVPLLERMQKTLDALPGCESEFVSEMLGEVDTTRFLAKEYEL